VTLLNVLSLICLRGEQEFFVASSVFILPDNFRIMVADILI